MDTAIFQRIAKLCGYNKNSEDVIPMTISRLRNSSVATVPTLLDLVLRGEMEII